MSGGSNQAEGGEFEVLKENADNWKKVIRMNELLGKDTDIGTTQEFSHIIELEYEDEEIKLRAKHLLLNHDPSMPPLNPDDDEKLRYYRETEKLTSRWGRVEHAKPPPPRFDDEG